jgi:hypothetical protein
LGHRKRKHASFRDSSSSRSQLNVTIRTSNSEDQPGHMKELDCRRLLRRLAVMKVLLENLASLKKRCVRIIVRYFISRK